jgi:hypothetical protein
VQGGTGAENRASTGIRSPDRRARSESLYRLRNPGPTNSRITCLTGYKHFTAVTLFLLAELPAAVATPWTLLGLNCLVTLYLFQKHLLCAEYIHKLDTADVLETDIKSPVVLANCFHPNCITSSVPPCQSQRLLWSLL